MRQASPPLGPSLRKILHLQLGARGSFLIITDPQTAPPNQSFALLSLGIPLNIFGEALAVACGANVDLG